MQEATAEAVATLEPLRHELADAVRTADSPKEARAAIAAVRKRHANDSAIADAIFIPRVMADLAGQLMVHEHEAPGAVVPAMPRVIQMALGDSQPIEAFLNLPWDEALDYFRERGVVSESDLQKLLRDHATETKDARRALLEQVQERTHALLGDAIEKGQTFDEFATALANDADGLGISNADPAYLQTVFRTNVMDAYGAGRAAAMNHPDVMAARPYRQIRTANDGRVREEHQQLEGLTFASDGPLAQLRPPFGFNCRCSVVSLSEYDGEVIDELPPGAVAPGFG